MALLSWVDFEARTNSTLSDPEGRALADTMAAGILAWSARYCNRLGWSYNTYTEVLNPREPNDTFYVSALPLDPAQPVTVSTYNYGSNAYDPYQGIVRTNPNGTVKTYYTLYGGFGAVQIAYTGGYTDNTFPADLKQALTDLLVQRFNNATTGGQTVSSVRAGDYSEVYDFKGMDIPGDSMEVLDSYRLPVVY